MSASRQVHGLAELLGNRAGPEAQALRPAGLDAGPLGLLRPAHLVRSTARRSDALAPYQREVISIHLYTELESAGYAQVLVNGGVLHSYADVKRGWFQVSEFVKSVLMNYCAKCGDVLSFVERSLILTQPRVGAEFVCLQDTFTLQRNW